MRGWQVHTLAGHSSIVYEVAFSRDGNRVVSGSFDKLVKIWDTATGVEVSSCVERRCGLRGGEVIVRTFPVGYGLREGVPEAWRGGGSFCTRKARQNYVWAGRNSARPF